MLHGLGRLAGGWRVSVPRPQLDTAEKQNDEATTWGVVRAFASGRDPGRLLPNPEPKHGIGIDRVGATMKPGVTTWAQFHTAVNGMQRVIAGALGFELNGVAGSVANLVSRRSLLGMENNLHPQRTSSSLWPVKWRGLVNERLPVTDEPLDRSEQCPTSSQFTTQPDPAIEPDLENKEKEPQPAELPWWMPRPHRAKFDLNPASANVPLFLHNQAHLQDRIQAPRIADWFRNSGSARPEDPTQNTAVEKSVETQVFSGESRIERLRGLLANVGLASLNRNRAPLAVDDVPQPIEIQAASESAKTDSVIDPPPSSNLAAEDFEAAPAIVSPREFVPVKESQVESAKTSSPESPGKTTAVFDDSDEIRILPAKRGQYTSRRRG